MAPPSRRSLKTPPIRALELLSGYARDCCTEALLRAGSFPLLVILVVASAANAAELLPRKFFGSWCLDSKDGQAAIYKKRPQPGDCQFTEDRIVVHANGFDTAESRCVLIEATPVTTAQYETLRAIFGCQSNKDRLDHWVFDAWMWTTDSTLGIQDTPDTR
jgi:hypothetical protein